MVTGDYLRYIVDEIHTTVVATVDGDGLPVTCAIDMMDWDDESLYFLTAKGKSFYGRLKRREYLALTGMKGESTMSCVAVSLRGKVRELGMERLPRLFEKNPYMYEIYPDEAARSMLTVFQVYAGTGEWFDLSKKPIERAQFTFGGAAEIAEGYIISDACTGCGSCREVCPQKCITEGNPFTIKQEHCIHCGACAEACTTGAVLKKVL